MHRTQCKGVTLCPRVMMCFILGMKNSSEAKPTFTRGCAASYRRLWRFPLSSTAASCPPWRQALGRGAKLPPRGARRWAVAPIATAGGNRVMAPARRASDAQFECPGRPYNRTWECHAVIFAIDNYAGEGAMSTCVVPIRGTHVAREVVVPL